METAAQFVVARSCRWLALLYDLTCELSNCIAICSTSTEQEIEVFLISACWYRAA